ncbi:hypothetical protein FSP39_001662 [Pinctada imbricata]|uniref:Interferon-related developmental regulator N-terminal domain-containing protein n=1 Tax=Pinctada imbricata TaxID=66713 RepID=A0AA88Y9V2_PINIB|nr:hypothetical protein FSP39_001662 [Pinctada imbricata]
MVPIYYIYNLVSLYESGGKKQGVESHPPSDEEAVENWSTASILSEDPSLDSVTEEGADGGPDETTAQENFEDKLKECIEGVLQKSAQGRKVAIDGICKALSKKYVYEFLLDRKLTLSDGLLRSLKRGKGDEQMLAARCLSLLCIQLGPEAEDLFDDIKSQLLVVATDSSAALRARAECAIAVAICNFVACSDIDVVTKVLDALENVFRASYRKGDKSIPSHTPDTCKLHASALTGWNLLLSIAPSFLVMKRVESHIARMPDLLHSADVDLRITAGETLALMYELAREEVERYRGPDIYGLCETLKNLATDSQKHRAKKDRKQQRASFRDVLRAIEEGDCPELSIRFGEESFYVDSWTRKHQYDAFCCALGSGIYQHLQDNMVIREVFDLGPPRIDRGNKKSNKATKLERVSSGKVH